MYHAYLLLKMTAPESESQQKQHQEERRERKKDFRERKPTRQGLSSHEA